jgi:hypothetical protein
MSRPLLSLRCEATVAVKLWLLHTPGNRPTEPPHGDHDDRRTSQWHAPESARSTTGLAAEAAELDKQV